MLSDRAELNELAAHTGRNGNLGSPGDRSLNLLTVLVAVITLLLVGVPLDAAIEPPFAYLERDRDTGRFEVTYENAGSTSLVSSIDALTAPAISPSGSRIAFSGAIGDGSLGLYAIFLVNTDGGGLVRLTSSSLPGELDPAWSPDGSTIAYSQNTGAYGVNCCRLVSKVIGGPSTNLTAFVGAKRPSFAADSSLIAYDTPSGVYTIKPVGGAATLRAAGGFDAAFSPDGRSLAFLQRSGSSYLLRRLTLSSGAISTLYSTSLALESPVWTADSILVVEHAGQGYDGRTSVRIRSIPTNGGAITTEKVFSGVVAELGVSPGDRPTRLAGDFTSDGRDDVIVIANGTRNILRSNGTGFSLEDWGDTDPKSGWAQHLVGDFTGNGAADLGGFLRSDGTWRVATSSGSAFSTAIWDTFSSGAGWRSRQVGDFNGDGEDDIAQFHPSNGTWWVSRSTGTAFATTLWDDFSSASGWGSQVTGDFDGDGLEDIANFHPSNGTWWVSRSTGSAFVTTLWDDFSTASGWASQLVGDFNGDGRDDIANYHSGNGTWWVSRSTGSGFVTRLWDDFASAAGWVSRVVGDFNGDGRDDIAQFHPSNGTWWVSRSTGVDFSTGLWADFSTPDGWTSQMVGDFNDDGRSDVANFSVKNGTWWISRSTGAGFVTDLWFSG